MTAFIDRAGLPEATEFIRRKLTAFDLSKLDKLTLKASLRSNPLSWRVKKPVRAAKGSREFKGQFEVTGLVIGEKYRSEDDGPVEVPVIASKEFGAPPELTVVLSTRAEMLVYGVAAGLYHFLRRTKQVPGVAANWMARRYACGWAKEFSPNNVQFQTNRPASNKYTHPFYNCLGLEIPSGLVELGAESMQFFDYAVSPYVFPEGELDERSIMAANREAIANAVDKSFGDCESAIVDEIKVADDPSTAWLVLADWLEERGDPRARWIRAQRLDLVAALMEQVRRELFEQKLLTSPIKWDH